jgi:glycosyltransferase involved in cell wall biosynthesis
LPPASLEEKLRLLRSSGLVDAAWYARQYPDTLEVGLDAAEHYLRVGADLVRDPGPAFDTGYYLENYPDVAAAGWNPLLHYLAHGRGEGRNCRPPARPPRQEAAAPSELELAGVERRGGRRERLAGRPTVLACGHMATNQLFGGERSFLDIVQGLAALEFNVVITIPPGKNTAYASLLGDWALDVLVIPYQWWQRGEAPSERIVAAFATLVHEYGIDAVHANTIMLREPIIAARRMGIPAVMHVRELLPHDEELCKMIGGTASEIIADAIEAADFVIANSAATARCFDKPGRTRVVPNTVDTDAFLAPPPLSGDGPVTIALVSSNLPKKGVAEFVEVATLLEAKLPNARFVLVGPRSEFTRSLSLQQAAGTAPSNLVVAGYCADPREAMAGADIVLNLSRFQESFGRTVLEAMAAGRPVVAYDWGAIPELVREGETGFLVPFGDVAQVAERIATLCADPSRLRSMGAAGRRRAVECYGHGSYARAMGDAYQDILGARESVASQPLRLPARRVARLAVPTAPRVAYFLWHFPVPSETFVLNELRVLVEGGHDVHVFCRRSPHPGFKPDFAIAWTEVADAAELARELTAMGRTVVHSHFVYPTVTDMVWPACELAGIPFTCIAHAQDIFRYRNDAANRIGDIGRSAMCLRILAPSRFHRDYLAERGVPLDKLVISPNGVDPALYRGAQRNATQLRARRSVCAVHRFTEKKGLIDLVEAGALLAADGIQVHLFGYGELEPALRARIEALGAGNVHVHGPVQGRQALLDVFDRHDLFACPSVRAADGDMDGIPTVLMEAMASGLPVLATALSGIPDLVRDGVTGLACEAGPAGIAAAIRRYYALSDDAVEAMVADAHALVCSDYHATRLTAALLRLWSDVTIDLMIVSWNNLAQLREVVRRLFAFTHTPFHLVVCDNGSAPDVAAFLCGLYAERDNVTVLFNRENAKVGPGTNLCMREGISPYAVYVCGKEGFLLDHGWERRLVDYMDAAPDVGLAGTLCHSPSYLTGRAYPKGVAEFPRFRNREFAADNPDRAFAHVQGGFFAIRRSMFDAIGGFSLDVPHNYTDVEYSYFVESRGWQLGQAPGFLALYNKTRPGIFSRVDEGVGAIHPPVPGDLPRLDRIAARQGAYCNACEWQGDAFLDAAACPRCKATPADRSLMRFLAESVFTYRRLPALALGLGDAMTAFWRQHFTGEPMGAELANARFASGGAPTREPGACMLVHVDLAEARRGDEARWLQAAAQALRADGTLLVRAPDARARRLDTLVADAARAAGLERLDAWRRASVVSRYDPTPLLVYGRARCE